MSARARHKPQRPQRDLAPLTKSLFLAVRHEDVASARRLIRKDKVPVNVVDPDDPELSTPLLVASELQNMKLVDLLLKLRRKASRIEEVPLNLRYDRKQGASKRNRYQSG